MLRRVVSSQSSSLTHFGPGSLVFWQPEKAEKKSNINNMEPDGHGVNASICVALCPTTNTSSTPTVGLGLLYRAVGPLCFFSLQSLAFWPGPATQWIAIHLNDTRSRRSTTIKQFGRHWPAVESTCAMRFSLTG
jgi:hypothetical protein